jgi:outer membrane lipoprotein-sorting protein
MFKNLFVMGLLIISTATYPSAANNDDPRSNINADTIIKNVSEIMAIDNMKSEQVMTVCREDGSIRKYRLRIMTANGDKAFAEIIEPKQFKGRQILRLGETVWAYFPDRTSQESRSKRRGKTAIRISGRDTFMGGDFNNNDILRLRWIEDYIVENMEDLPDQYVLQMKGKNLSHTYATLRLWVRKVDFQPIKMECYTIGDDLIKSVFYQDYRDFGDGLTRPGMLEVKSAILPKSKTFLEIIYLKRGVDNPAYRFQRSRLGK